MTPSLSGWHKTSRTERRNSGISSKIISLCAGVTSPQRNTSDQVCFRNEAGKSQERHIVEVSQESALTAIKHPTMRCERASGIARAFSGWWQPLS
jgi:hypothetical protein